jgi:hypothetical protein
MGFFLEVLMSYGHIQNIQLCKEIVFSLPPQNKHVVGHHFIKSGYQIYKPQFSGGPKPKIKQIHMSLITFCTNKKKKIESSNVLAPLFVLNIMQFHHTILFISDF